LRGLLGGPTARLLAEREPADVHRAWSWLVINAAPVNDNPHVRGIMNHPHRYLSFAYWASIERRESDKPWRCRVGLKRSHVIAAEEYGATIDDALASAARKVGLAASDFEPLP
jgi:hypothetical protein